MKTLNQRIADIAFHLQMLATPEFSSQVQDAVEKKDRTLLVEVCKKAKVTAIYLGPVASVLLSVAPMQKWPEIL